MAWQNQEQETGLRSACPAELCDPGNEKKLDPRFRHSLGFLPTPLSLPGRARGPLGVRGSSQSPISAEPDLSIEKPDPLPQRGPGHCFLSWRSVRCLKLPL